MYTLSLSQTRALSPSPLLSLTLSLTHTLSHMSGTAHVYVHTHTHTHKLPHTHTHNVWDISSTGIQLYTKRLSVDIPTCCSCCYNPAAIWRSRIGKEPQACKKIKIKICYNQAAIGRSRTGTGQEAETVKKKNYKGSTQ